MGSSAGKAPKESGLTPDQEKRILDLLNLKKKPDGNTISPTLIQSLWSRYLVDELMFIYLKSISAENKNVNFEGFVSLYVNTELLHNEDKARALVKLNTIDDPNAQSVEKETFLQFVEWVLESGLKILKEGDEGGIKSWRRVVPFDPPPQTRHLAQYLCSSLPDKDGAALRVDEIEGWLNECRGFSEMSSLVMKTLYNQTKEGSVMTIPVLLGGGSQSSVMNATEFLFLSLSLGPRYRKEWRLVFSTKRDGESWTVFNKSVQRQGPTLIVIQDKDGSIFGGFASVSWKPSAKFYGDDSSFLFTLEPKINLFESTGYNANFQYLNTGQKSLPNGLGMGGQFGYWGLWVSSEFGDGSVSETCTTFKEYSQLSPRKEFKVKDMEVWAVSDPDPTPEELGERKAGGPSGMDATTEALLEMAGKTLHGKVFREEAQGEDSRLE